MHCDQDYFDDLLIPPSHSHEQGAKFRPKKGPKVSKPSSKLTKPPVAAEHISSPTGLSIHSSDSKHLAEGKSVPETNDSGSFILSTFRSSDVLAASPSEGLIFNADNADTPLCRKEVELALDANLQCQDEFHLRGSPFINTTEGSTIPSMKVVSPQGDAACETLCEAEEQENHMEVSTTVDLDSQGKANISKSMTEMSSTFFDMKSFDSLSQPDSTVVDEVDNFHPKLVQRPKWQTKSVSFMLPQPAGTLSAPEYETNDRSKKKSDELAHDYLEMDVPFMQMMDEGLIHIADHRSSINHDLFGGKGSTEISDFEAFENSLLQNSTAEEATSSYGDFAPSDVRILALNSHGIVASSFHSSGMQTCDSIVTNSSEDNANPFRASEVETDTVQDYVGVGVEDAEALSNPSRDSSGKEQLQSVDELSNDIPAAFAEDAVNDSVAQMAEEHDVDEHTQKDVPKTKKKSKRCKKETATEEPVRKRKKKVSEGPVEVTLEKPPKKKVLPRATKRKRRQVDKALLDVPEDDIDPRQLSISNLIMLAEAKERISNRVEAALRKSDSISSSIDGEEQHQKVQPTEQKVNYHSHMKRLPPGRWSKAETELLFKALDQFGTDFTMIQQLFPNKTRQQIKLKFKNEERKRPLYVADALLRRTKDNSHFELLIKQLKAKSAENRESTGDASLSEDQFGVAQDDGCDPTTTNEEEAAGTEDQAQNLVEEADSVDEGVEKIPNKMKNHDVWDEGAIMKSPDKMNSPDNFDVSQVEFDWDSFEL